MFPPARWHKKDTSPLNYITQRFKNGYDEDMGTLGNETIGGGYIHQLPAIESIDHCLKSRGPARTDLIAFKHFYLAVYALIWEADFA